MQQNEQNFMKGKELTLTLCKDGAVISCTQCMLLLKQKQKRFMFRL